MAAKTEPTERQSAGATAGSGDMLHKFDERLRALKDLQHTSSQQTPVEDLHGSDDKSNKQLEELKGQLEDLLRPGPQRGPVEDLPSLIPRDHSKSALTSPSTIRITGRLDDETSDRVQTIKSQRKKRTSRGFARYLSAICIGVGATVAWQSYGDAAKQMIATSAPELGWSPEAKQMIASWVQQLGWTKQPGPENAAIQLSVPKMPQAAPLAQASGPETVASTSKTPAAPSLDQQQVQVQQSLEQRLAVVQATVEQLAVSQDRVLREIAKLHQEILNKVPAPPPPRPIAAPARKPTSTAPPQSRAPIPPAPP
jgi:hypothetical protein